MMTKTCVVSGSSGFIAHSLIRELSKQGYDVIGVDLNIDKMNTNFLEEKYRCNAEVKFYQGDCRRLEQIDHLIERADICYHLAAQTDVQSSIQDPFNDFDHNVLGSYNVMNSCMKHETKLVFTSSFAVYGNAKPPIPETAELNPISPYGMSKVITEQLIGMYQRSYGLDATILRLSNIYGPMDFKSVIYHFLVNNQDHEPIKIIGTGSNTRDYLYVQDAVNAIIEAADMHNGIFNIGTGKQTSLTRLLSIIRDMDENPRMDFTSSVKGDIEHSCADMKHTFKHMGWRPKYDVRKGMEKFDAWLRETRT